MSSTTVRSGFDTWAGKAKPSREHPREKALNLQAVGTNVGAEAFVWLKNPVPRKATVISATLTLHAKGDSSGSRSLTVQRVTESWKEGRLNFDNRPSSTSASAASSAVATLHDGDPISFDVTNIVQAWTGGTANFGFRITSDAASQHAVYSLNSTHKPTLSVIWGDPAGKPTNLRPSGAGVGLAKPHVVFDYVDNSGDTSLAAVQVQISTSPSFASPVFDSGEVLTDSPGLDLATTTYAGIPSGATVYWRARAKETGGSWGPYADPVTMIYKAKPTLTITNLGAGQAFEPTPPIFWAMPGQVRWRLLVFKASDRSRPIYDTKPRVGTATAHTIPDGVLKDGHTYTVEVRGWDDVVRDTSPGDSAYATAQADFTLATDPTTNSVATLTAAPDGVSPWVVLTWTRSTTPDSFALYRDGVPVKAEIDPADAFVSGSTYRYRYSGALPNREHTYAVRAVVNGKMSPNGPTVDFTTSPSGLWLVDFDRNVNVTLWGNDDGSWTMTDDASVYAPVGSTEIVRIVSGMRGLEGTLTGLLMEGFGKTFDAMEADLLSIKERPTEAVRIIAGDANFRALIGNVSIAPKPETRQGHRVKAVSLDFWQINDLGFDPQI